MLKLYIILALLAIFAALFLLLGNPGQTKAGSAPSVKEKKMEYKKLTPEEEQVILQKGTERPFSGKYFNVKEIGTYICRQCGAPLYKSSDKFESGCGWPSFDDEIPGAVRKQTDGDGVRTEILCANCAGHLGHVFLGEGLTEKNTRHCVNSVSLEFLPFKKQDTAYFAGGCFWGVEYYFTKEQGVLSTTVGYMGGSTSNPTYQQVCSGTSGHLETMQVVFDPQKTNYELLAKLFFEIHDPTQADGQGPDIGEQYKSVVFYNDDSQMFFAYKLIKYLKQKGLNVVTEVRPAPRFWPAEDYHQLYYQKNGHRPYCHFRKIRF